MVELERVLGNIPVNQRAVRLIFHRSEATYATVMTVAMTIGPTGIVAALSAAKLIVFLFMFAGGVTAILSLIFFRRISEAAGRAEVRFDEHLLERCQNRKRWVLAQNWDLETIRGYMEKEGDPTNTEIQEEARGSWNEVLELERRYWLKGIISLISGCGLCLLALLLHVLRLK